MRTTADAGSSPPASSSGHAGDIRFVSPVQQCPSCATPLRTVRSRPRVHHSLLLGTRWVRPLDRACRHHPCPLYRPPQMALLGPPRARYGYDLELGVMLAHYADGRAYDEIGRQLEQEFSLTIPATTLGDLGRRGLSHLGVLHEQETAGLRDLLMAEGGYILHLDGTREADSPTMVLASAYPVGIRLGATLVRTESAAECIPFLAGLKARYPPPVRVMRDMGKGIQKAVTEVFPDVPQGVCASHFIECIQLRCFERSHRQLDLGLRALKIRKGLRDAVEEARKDLGPAEDLRPLWRELQQGRWSGGLPRERRAAVVTTALAGWILDGEWGMTEPAFPFGLPMHALYRRCLAGLERARQFRRVLSAELRVYPPLATVEEVLGSLAGEEDDARRLRGLEEEDRWLEGVCDGVRERLGFRRRADLLVGAVCWQREELERIRTGLERFLEEKSREVASLSEGNRRRRGVAAVRELVAEQEAHLFVTNPEVDAGAGRVVLPMLRTNCPQEGQFWETAQPLHRVSGSRPSWRMVERAGPALFLVPNLRRAAYLESVTGRTGNLLGRMAQVTTAERRAYERSVEVQRWRVQRVAVPERGRSKVLERGEAILSDASVPA